MKTILFVFGICLLSCISCGPKVAQSSYILSDEQLSNLMLDMQLTDVALGEVNGLERDSLKKAFALQLEKVYKQPIKELEAEVRTLEGDPEKLNLVMDRVQVLLDSLR